MTNLDDILNVEELAKILQSAWLEMEMDIHQPRSPWPTMARAVRDHLKEKIEKAMAQAYETGGHDADTLRSNR